MSGSGEPGWFEFVLGTLIPRKKTQDELLKDFRSEMRSVSRQMTRDINKIKGERIGATDQLEKAIRAGKDGKSEAKHVVSLNRRIIMHENAMEKLRGVEARCEAVTMTHTLSNSILHFTNVMGVVSDSIDVNVLTSALESFEETENEMDLKTQQLNGMFSKLSTRNTMEDKNSQEIGDPEVEDLLRSTRGKIHGDSNTSELQLRFDKLKTPSEPRRSDTPLAKIPVLDGDCTRNTTNILTRLEEIKVKRDTTPSTDLLKRLDEIRGKCVTPPTPSGALKIDPKEHQ